jgi:hypothetical protein
VLIFGFRNLLLYNVIREQLLFITLMHLSADALITGLEFLPYFFVVAIYKIDYGG